MERRFSHKRSNRRAVSLLLSKYDSESLNRKSRFGWLIATFLFGAIALDDAVGFHERIGAITSLDFMEDIHYKSYPWHITVAPIFGIAFIVMLTLILLAIRKIEGLFSLLILALSLFALILGIDFLEGIELMAAAGSEVLNEGTSRKIATLMVTEEFSEMAGTILFLHIFVSCFCSEVQSIEFKKREPEAVEG